MPLKDFIKDLTPHKQMEFSPVEDDDDELSEFIKSDPLAHDDHWDLKEGLDGDKLDAFWTDALHELGPLETEQDEDRL